MNTTQNIQAAVIPTVMASALHNANITSIEKAVDSVTAPAVHSLVIRKDLLGNKYAFRPETQDKVAGTVDMWDGKKGSKPTPVALMFYKTTVPIESEAEVQDVVQRYSKEFGVKNLVLRKRLIKDSVLNRDDSGSVAQTDLNVWKQKLKAALIKAVDEM